MNLFEAARDHGTSIWLQCPEGGSILPDELRDSIESIPVDGLALDFPCGMESLRANSPGRRRIRRLVHLGLPPEAIFTRLLIGEIRKLVEVLLPAFERSNGRRGFLSVPLIPLLSTPDDPLIVAAESLWQTINRPNLIIALPCTSRGLEAFSSCLERGLNVEVRSVLTLEEFNQIRNLHRMALEGRAKRGQATSHITAVAAVELNRIDQILNRDLSRLAGDDSARNERLEWLQNKAALAVADLILAQQGVNLGSEEPAAPGMSELAIRWDGLRSSDPSIDVDFYLDPLVGSDSIVTIDFEMIDALSRNENIITPRKTDMSVSRAQIEAIENLGVDIDGALTEARTSTAGRITDQKRAVVERLRDLSEHDLAELGMLAPAVQAAAADLQKQEINRRIWELEQNRRENPHWLGLAQGAFRQLHELKDLVRQQIALDVMDTLLVVGACDQTFPLELFVALNAGPSKVDVRIIHRLDPIAMREVLRGLQPETAWVLVLEWDHDQTETPDLLAYLWEWFSSRQAIRPEEHFIALARNGSRLAAIADKRSFQMVHFYEIPGSDDHGALSQEVLLPAVLAGLDIEPVLTGVRDTIRACSLTSPLEEHPGMYLAAIMVAMVRSGRRILTLFSDSSSAPVQRWLAEQLDLAGRGIQVPWMVVCEEQPGRGNDYGETCGLIYLRVDGKLDKKCSGWMSCNHPVFIFQLDPQDEDLGASIASWQYAVAAAAKLLAVEAANLRDHDSARRVETFLKTWERKGDFAGDEAPAAQEGFSVVGCSGVDLPAKHSMHEVWTSALDSVGFDGGVRLNFFMHLPAGVRRMTGRVQRLLRDRRRCWLIVEEGRLRPRIEPDEAFHAVEITLSVQDTRDLAIPGKKASFNIVQRARARAAYRAAIDRGYPALHIELQDDQSLKACMQSLVEILKQNSGPLIEEPDK